MFGDGALTFREFAMGEPLPLATIHDAVLGFLRGRDDAALYGAQAVNAYVDEARMTQDVDILSPRAEELAEEIRKYLNDQFRGFTLSEARETLILRLREERDLYHRVVKSALTLGKAAFAENKSSADLYLEGTSRMLNKPEFASNIHRVQQLFTTLEEKNRLLEILNACLEGRGPQIVIGSEARVPDLEGMSLIAASYRFLDRELGSVGIMGPTRMEYDKFISVVDYIAFSLSDTISQAAGRPRDV